MVKISKGKFWFVLLLILLDLLFFLTKNNYKYNRYIYEDIEQSINRLNEEFNSIRDGIKNILSNDEKIQVDYEEINNLMTLSMSIDRELFNLKKKSRIIEGKLGKEIQVICDDFDYNDNTEKIKQYYKSIKERLYGKSYVKLEENDIKELKSILSFYNNTKDKINKLHY